MASVNLVTSHKGVNHITVDNVRDLIAGLSGRIGGINVFSNLDDGLDENITNLREITIKKGQGLAGGYHFQLTEPYIWELDDLAVGYSRIDMLYLVIYKDNQTLVQTADLVPVTGNPFPNGTSGTEPGPPTGTNILETFRYLSADLTDGAITSVLTYYSDYLSNYSLETEFTGNINQINENTDALNGFRFGIDSQGRYGYKKVGADTVIPFRNPTGNATQADVLINKTFSNANNDNISGQMPDNQAVSKTLTPGSSYVVPRGYHNGNGRVSASPNSGTYTFPSGSNGETVDMQPDNLNRYVNAVNVREYGRGLGRADESQHTITCQIIGATNQGFTLEIMLDGQYVFPPINAAGQIGEMGYQGSGIYYCDISGSAVGYTSYNGGLHS